MSPREEELRDWHGGIPPKEGRGGIPWRRIVATLAEWGDRRAGISLFPGPGGWTGVPHEGWSATELDGMARCPYRYFLQYRVGLSPVEEPEEELSLTPAEAGLILHDILHALGKEAITGRGWGDAAPAAKRAIARFARQNPTGLPGLFRLRCREIERDVEKFVEWERARASGSGARRVEAVEHRFSVDENRGLPAFRGRVDRIDRGPVGEAEIIDYKYRDGKRENPPLEWIAHGLSSQIPVYLTFAQDLSPPTHEILASLLFLKGGVRTVTVSGAQWKAVREEWEGALRELLAIAAAGFFPPLPHHRFRYAGSPPPRYCDSCGFRDHCRVSPAFEGAKRETEALVRRVGRDPALRWIGEHRPHGEGPG